VARPLPPLLVALAALVTGAACGGGGPASTDAGGSPADGHGPDVSYPACREFAVAPVAVPAHVLGVLAGADVLAPQGCAVVDAPFGAESRGPDAVIRLGGLTPGAPYVVHLTAAADLAFYVVTACDTATGPSAAACLLFEDAQAGPAERGRFVATGDAAYVVVDDYMTQPPADPAFFVDVYAEECQGPAQCGGATPVCDDGRCVECETGFDCVDPARPVCDSVADRCQPGVNQCARDDAHEDADDGPAGATALVPDAGGVATLTGTLCASPITERDFARFEVTSPGDSWQLTLAWTGPADLDLQVRDAHGVLRGMSYWEQPERVRLTYLPPGTYDVELRDFSATPDPTPVDYTLTLQRTPGAPCAGAADCAAEYRDQLFRGACVAGACVDLVGGGAIPTGGACDSQDDCVAGDGCASFYFVADADTRDRCAPTCAGDADCVALGDVCTTYLTTNICVAPCRSDAQCPTAPDQVPVVGPWRQLRCDAPSGRCVP
jgi:hypothetical protein